MLPRTKKKKRTKTVTATATATARRTKARADLVERYPFFTGSVEANPTEMMTKATAAPRKVLMTAVQIGGAIERRRGSEEERDEVERRASEEDEFFNRVKDI